MPDKYTQLLDNSPSSQAGAVLASPRAAPPRRRLEITGVAPTVLLLFLASVGLGVLSMYFASAETARLAAFFRYFNVPVLLALNILPVALLIFALYFIFNRVWAAFAVCAVVTLLITLVNYFKLLLRNDPLMASDIRLLWEAGNMGRRYDIAPDWRIISAVALCVAATVLMFFFARGRLRSRVTRACGLAAVLCAGALCYATAYVSAPLYAQTENLAGIPDRERYSATKQYTSRGFIYPFLHSIQTARARPPEGYDETQASGFLSDYAYDDIPADKKVNIVTIMCEAFNDFSKFDGLDFTYDLYAPFHALRERSLSGELVTNVFAGGTVNTERGFLTGFSGEYDDYRGDINSYVRYFKEQGYVTEGSHPGSDWFYNRNNVNSYLGFDRYYFNENRYFFLSGGAGFVDDEDLFSDIRTLYEDHVAGSDAPYFSFNVTIQNHGPYDTQTEFFDREYISGDNLSRESYVILNNYFSGLAATVRDIAEMADYFDGRRESVLFIVFGDHNPWLGNGNSVYTELGVNFDFGDGRGFSNYYNTPYIVFANDAAKTALGDTFVGDGGTMSPCFLLNEIFKRADLGGNEFMKAANEIMAVTPVLHATGACSVGGTITYAPAEDARKRIERFKCTEFYWRWNIRDNPP
ncbi:MAG: sulfatase-like hydrolase/transferase [Oscillospiraceae bacterium]|nr:sulfatase-like hydrolase/transferase [Oscillospiraceae bacterium]